MASQEREKIYECEVKRRQRRKDGAGYEPFWKLKSVQDAVDDNDTEFRCKDCHGAVKLHRRKVAHGPASHAEHLSRVDSEYCPAGMYFLKATDGRTARLSASPVE